MPGFVVAGAAETIGAATVKLAAARGYDVALLDIDGEGLARAAAALDGTNVRVVAHVLDLTDEHATQAAAEQIAREIGPLAGAFHAVALRNETAPLTFDRLDEWRRTLEVDLTSAAIFATCFLPLLEPGRGVMIFTGSNLAHVGLAGRASYCAAKGGLLQLARALALEQAPRGVRVVTVSPGGIETGRLVWRYGSIEKAREAMVADYPLGRLGRPEEIAHAVLWLASPEAGFVTGTDILVDGGYCAR